MSTPVFRRIGFLAVRAAKALVFGIAIAIGRTFSAVGFVIARGILFPFYRTLTNVKLAISRLAIPARSFAVTLLTNRYLFHGIIATVAIAAVSSNFAARQARAQDVGQTSILYDLVAADVERSTEQNGASEALVKDTRHGGQSSLVATNIDYDYAETESPELIPPSMPGTLAANLAANASEEPKGPNAVRTEIETYTVKDGDTLSTIAQQFGVNVGTILWANSRTATQYIRPGDTLRIPPVSGVLVTIKKNDTLAKLAQTYGADIEDILAVNRLDRNGTLPVGAELILPGGTPPAAPVSRPIAGLPPPSSYRNEPPASVERPPGSSTQKPPDADTSSAPTTKLFWPTSGHVITQYYGWHHTGLDLDGDYSSPLYAAHDGVVTTAGWNSGGYGLQIIIEGDGVKTRYGHSSKIFVKVGDHVKRGQVIAMMGTTGRSTGTHLHFEVYINGVRTNPLKYLK